MEDVHVHRFAEHSPTCLIFAIDASGSAALHRLAEAKGVPPPPGKPLRLRLARTNDFVGGNNTSAVVPRKPTTQT